MNFLSNIFLLVYIFIHPWHTKELQKYTKELTITEIKLEIVYTAAVSSFPERSEFDSFDSRRDETEQQTVDESDQDIIEQNFHAMAMQDKISL